MDDSPKAFFEELRASLLRKRVGQIALAVILAQAAWRLVIALTWNLIVPLIGKALHGNTESVLFARANSNPFPWENLFGSLLEFALTVIMVFYLNRWVHRRRAPEQNGQPSLQAPEPEYSLTGEELNAEQDEPQRLGQS